MNLKEYTDSIENALPHAHNFYFPQGKENRKRANIRLAHELGYGLAPFDGWEDYAQSSYSRLLARYCFDRTGMVLDAKEWRSAIEEGVRQYRAFRRGL